MSIPTLTCIVPTCGRILLARLLGTLIPQMIPDDRVLVVGDGPQLWAERFCVGIPHVTYVEGPKTNCYGNAQRQHALALVETDYVIFADDDDRFIEGALLIMREAAEQAPGKPMLGQFIDKHGLVLWADPNIRQGNVSTQMICFPASIAKIGTWGARYEGDYDYIQSVASAVGEDAFVWRPNIWQTARG